MQQRVRSTHQHLQQHHVQYWQIRNAIKEELMHSSHSNHDMVQTIKHLLESGHGTRLANAIYLYDTKQKAAHSTDPSGLSAYYPPLPEALPPVYDCRTQWDLRLRHELHAVAHKQKRSLLQLRSVQSESDEYIIRFVYTSEDLLETMMTGIVNPNHVHTSYTWTCLRVYLEMPTLSTLRTRYAELRPEIRHVGVDEQVEGMEWFRTERLKKGTELLSQGYIPAMRQFAKTGIPASLRPRMWSMMMNVNVGQQELHYFESLLSQVQQYDMITDDLTRFDVQDACDHDEFFVFEEVLDEMMLAFSRDTQIASMCSITPNTAVLNINPTDFVPSSSPPPPSTIPPSTIIPFHRQCMFAAPICFLYHKSEDAYFLFRALYTRMWVKLHVITTQSDSILYLSKMFESLISTRDTTAFTHCLSLGVDPVSIVFPWMFSAFAGWIETDQVLLLWDRCIAYQSLELLAILSAAIFIFRSKSVMNARSSEELRDAFRELSHIKIIPLLQSFLFTP